MTVHQATIQVAGTNIAWSSWGVGSPPLVLVHGGGAHAGWWSATVREMGPMQQVVTLDLSGHGESGHRPRYDYRQWTEEVLGVIRHCVNEPVVLVCHSMGGRVGVLAAAASPEFVNGLVLVDSVIPTHSKEPMPKVRPHRRYATADDARSAFHLHPDNPTLEPETADELMTRSLTRHHDGSWVWKFDPNVFAASSDGAVNHALAQVHCPTYVIHAANSPVTGSTLTHQLIGALPNKPNKYIVVPAVGHHLMLQSPKTMASLLDSIQATKPLAPQWPVRHSLRKIIEHIRCQCHPEQVR